MFPTHIYDRRRQALRSRFEGGVLLFLGNDESPMNYRDNAYPFRQDSSFLYYFGLDHPHLAAAMDLDEGWTAIFGDELGIDDIVWMGDLPTLAERAHRVGMTDVRPRTALAELMGRAVAGGREVRYLPPYRAEHILELAATLKMPAAEVPERASTRLIRAVVDQRSVKSDEEVLEIERAVTVSVEMHVAAMRMARPGLRESDIAAEVHRIALTAGSGIAFPVIATVNGQTLHNHFHGNTLNDGDLFLLDAGAQTAMGYAGDLSSTFPVSPTFTERQRHVYAIQLAAYDAAIDLLRPGAVFRDVHFAACRVIAEGMKDLGLMRGNVDDAVEAGAHAMFFPCGLGHMMGLDVHDMENLGEVWVGWAGEEKSSQFGLKSLRLGRRLEAGFVLTVEPGIYFVPQLMDLWRSEGRHTEFLVYDRLEDWRRFGGIRNEEDFLITADGAHRLGPAKPVSIDEIESLRS